MSIDSLRIQDIFRGTEAEVVNHFAGKNKTIQDLQAAVGTLAVSTDTNRVMIFTGPTSSGTHTRGDFTWNTFASDSTYTLDDSVVGQYNPLIWFDASHVSNEYMGGAEGLVRDPIRSSDLSRQSTVRPLTLDPNNNNGTLYNYGDWHMQGFHNSNWNAYPGGVGYTYGIDVNPNKFLRQHDGVSIWMSAVSGSDHGAYKWIYYSDGSFNIPDKLEDRAAAVPAGFRLGTTAASLDWNGVTHGKIIHRDGHKYFRSGIDSNATGPHADCSFLFESDRTYPFGTTCFQIIRKAPAYNGAAVPLVQKARFGDVELEVKVHQRASTMGGGAPGSFNANGQTMPTWRNHSNYSTANNHFYIQKSTGNKSLNFAGASYIPAWGYYSSQRAQIHDTSIGGGSNVGTVTYDYNTFVTELASNSFSNLEGNIVEIDNNNMPDNIILAHGDNANTYVGSTIPYDWHILASGNKPIGWQTFYVPKWDAPQMRVYPYGAGIEQTGAWNEERLNGFGQTKYRNDYQTYMLRPSVDAGHGFDGANYSKSTRSGAGGKHMFDQSKDNGLIWQLGNPHGTLSCRLGQNVATSGGNNYQMAVDVAETIIVPTPGTYSAYLAMVANIEGYLAAKYNIQEDCSLNVPA